MEQRPDDPLSRWLAAESDERQQEAEAALAELMADLPRWAPPAGFAGRVMLAVAATPMPAPVPAALPTRAGGLFASRWLQAALAFTLAAAALVAALAPDVLVALLGLVSPGWVVTLGVSAVTAGAGLLGAGLDLLLGLLLGLETLGRAAALLLSAPEVAASLAGCALVSTLSFYLLKSLLANRSWSHVHPV